jgi:hypothetical protein
VKGGVVEWTGQSGRCGALRVRENGAALFLSYRKGKKWLGVVVRCGFTSSCQNICNNPWRG